MNRRSFLQGIGWLAALWAARIDPSPAPPAPEPVAIEEAQEPFYPVLMKPSEGTLIFWVQMWDATTKVTAWASGREFVIEAPILADGEMHMVCLRWWGCGAHCEVDGVSVDVVERCDTSSWEDWVGDPLFIRYEANGEMSTYEQA